MIPTTLTLAQEPASDAAAPDGDEPLAEGNRYEPLELAEEHRDEGAMVSAVLRRLPDRTGACQLGPVVAVVSIEAARFDPGRVVR